MIIQFGFDTLIFINQILTFSCCIFYELTIRVYPYLTTNKYNRVTSKTPIIPLHPHRGGWLYLVGHPA